MMGGGDRIKEEHRGKGGGEGGIICREGQNSIDGRFSH